MMLLKCCTQYANKLGKLNIDHRTENSQFYIGFLFQLRSFEYPESTCWVDLLAYLFFICTFSKYLIGYWATLEQYKCE